MSSRFTKYHEIDELVDTCSETLAFLFMDGLLTRIKKQAVKWRKEIFMKHSRFWISSSQEKNKYHPCQCRKTKVASCQVHAAATGRTSGGPMGRGPAGPPGRNETRAAKFGTHSYRVWTPAQEEFPALRVDPFFPILENYLTTQELSQSYHPIYLFYLLESVGITMGPSSRKPAVIIVASKQPPSCFWLFGLFLYYSRWDVASQCLLVSHIQYTTLIGWHFIDNIMKRMWLRDIKTVPLESESDNRANQ